MLARSNHTTHRHWHHLEALSQHLHGKADAPKRFALASAGIAPKAGEASMEEAGKAAAFTEDVLRLLQLRHKKLSRERFGAYLITSIDDGGGKVHRWL